jgi:hypothetical protein
MAQNNFIEMTDEQVDRAARLLAEAEDDIGSVLPWDHTHPGVKRIYEKRIRSFAMVAKCIFTVLEGDSSDAPE